MAITLRYNPAYDAAMGVAQQTGQGELQRRLQELANRNAMEQARIDEGARQFDLSQAAQQYNQTAQRGLQYASLGANFAQNQAELQQRGQQFQYGIDARLAEQQMQGDQMLAGQAMQNQRAFVGEQSRMAREAANRRFEKSMKDREVLLDQFQRGGLTPKQQQQAISQWENDAQMDWGMPDQMAAQEDNQAQQDRVAALESTFFTHPLTKAPLIEPGAVAKMMELGMDPDKIIDKGLKLQSEARQTAALQQEPIKQEQAREDKKIASAQDTYKYGQQAFGDYQQAQADYAGKVSEFQAEQAAHEAAVADWEEAKKQHAAQPAPTDGKPKKPFTQKRPSFTKVQPVAPLPMQYAGSTGFPVARSMAEAMAKLESGEWAEGTPFLTPDGQMKILRLKQQ